MLFMQLLEKLVGNLKKINYKFGEIMQNYLATIKITLRKGILDVQGKAVEHALHSLEYQMIGNVRIGKYVELSVEAANKESAMVLVEEACKKLIANPIIEDFEINIKD
jgi:phosphoribosylformylglycinamidine synthase PurS subunit